MTLWKDAIDKFRLCRYSITLDGEKLRYAYQGKDDPPQDEITPLLEVLKAHREEILNDPYFLIEQALQRINEGWESGTLERIKSDRLDEWSKVIALEQRINLAMSEEDLRNLKRALESYQDLLNKLKKG
jgi:hypothetical protein